MQYIIGLPMLFSVAVSMTLIIYGYLAGLRAATPKAKKAAKACLLTAFITLVIWAVVLCEMVFLEPLIGLLFYLTAVLDFLCAIVFFRALGGQRVEQSREEDWI